MIPAIERAFPDVNVVVRPHPTERHDVYNEIAGRCDRVRVNNTGNVVPWLKATRALVNNSCTTGAEAYAMGVPAVSYRARVDDRYDLGFYRLPNLLSHQCFSLEELGEALRGILNGELGAADGAERKLLVDRYLAAQEGPLACERIVDVIEEMTDGKPATSKPGLMDRFEGRSVAAGRRLFKQFKARLPASHNKPEFQRHRYPEVSLEHMRSKTARFQDLLGERKELAVEPFLDRFFRLQARD
jgi:hypothetical protein